MYMGSNIPNILNFWPMSSNLISLPLFLPSNVADEELILEVKIKPLRNDITIIYNSCFLFKNLFKATTSFPEAQFELKPDDIILNPLNGQQVHIHALQNMENRGGRCCLQLGITELIIFLEGAVCTAVDVGGHENQSTH